MVGLTDYDLAPRTRAEQLIAAEAGILQAGRPLNHFEEFLVEEGKPPRWCASLESPLRNRQGDMVSLAGVTVDITEKSCSSRNCDPAETSWLKP